MWSVGGAVSCDRAGGAGADQPVVAERHARCRRAQRRVDQVDARGQAVLGEHHVVGMLAERQQGVAGPDDVASPQLQRIDVERERQLV